MRLFLLSLFCLSLCLLIDFAASQAINYVGVPPVSNSPWTTSSFPTRFQLSSTDLPSLSGSAVGFSPFIASPGIQSTGIVRYRLAIPHSADVNSLGCGYTRSALEDGTPLAGLALLVPRGLCPFAVKQQIAAGVGAGLLLVYDNQLPSNAINNLPPTFLGDLTSPFNFAALGLNKRDGDKLASMLKFNATGNSLNPIVYLDVAGSGYLENWNSTAVGAPAATDPAATDLLFRSLVDFTRASTPSLVALAVRPWSDIKNPSFDPCFHRLLGFWCEKGKIVRFDLGFAGWSKAVSSGIGALKDLKLLSAPGNSIISFPTEICSCTKLEYITLSNNPSLTSFPNCYDGFINLVALDFAASLLTNSISTLGPANNNLVWVSYNGNSIRGSLAMNGNGFISNKLEYLDLTNNRLNNGGLTGPMPSFTNNIQLKYIDLSNNYLNEPNTNIIPDSSTMLNGLSLLNSINFKNNIISGPLPSLISCSALIFADFSLNNYSGPAAPSSYLSSNLPVLQQFFASKNRLMAPFIGFGALNSLLTLDLSYNEITNYNSANPVYSTLNSWLAMALSACSASLQTLIISNNKLIGPSYPTLIISRNGLTKFDASNNFITSLPSDLFANSGLSYFDISNNRLDSTALMPVGTPSSKLIFLSFAGNPEFINPSLTSPLPSWVGLQSKTLISNIGESFSCKKLIPTGLNTNPLLTIGLDPTYYHYVSCACEAGTFGSAPNCRPIPTSNNQFFKAPVIQPGNIISSTFSPNIDEAAANNNFTNSPAASANGMDLFNLNISEIPIQSYSLSDSWYGNQRTLTGIDTVWTVDLKNSLIAHDSYSGNRSYVDNNSAASAAAAATASLKEIRQIRVEIFFNLDEFQYPSDKLDFYNGNSDIRGKLLKSYRGSDSIKQMNLVEFQRNFNLLYRRPQSNNGNLNSNTLNPTAAEVNSLGLNQYLPYMTNIFSTPLLNQYESIISKFPRIGYGRLTVVSNEISINFQSRSKSGQHFYMIYSASELCPDSFLESTDTLCKPVIPEYEIVSGLSSAIYAASTLIALPILFVSAYLYRQRGTALVRAASRPFTAFMLLNLLFMAGSASLYAIQPKGQNSFVCHARVWCSSVSLMGVLGVLVAKAFRISVIFGSKVLLEIKALTDFNVAMIVSAFLLLQFIMLSIFSIFKMSEPVQEAINGGNNLFYDLYQLNSPAASIAPTAFTPLINADFASLKLAWACEAKTGFNEWMGIQIAIFAGTMIAGAMVAFKTREVPSAFNESTHILMSLQLLLLFLIMLVPLDWLLVNKSPESSIVIQAGGQLVLALFLSAIHFGPKLWYLMSGHGDDRSMVTTHFEKNSQLEGGGLNQINSGGALNTLKNLAFPEMSHRRNSQENIAASLSDGDSTDGNEVAAAGPTSPSQLNNQMKSQLSVHSKIGSGNGSGNAKEMTTSAVRRLSNVGFSNDSCGTTHSDEFVNLADLGSPSNLGSVDTATGMTETFSPATRRASGMAKNQV